MMVPALLFAVVLSVLGLAPPSPPAPIGLHFSAAVFNHSMILQRNAPTALWGGGAGSDAIVTVHVHDGETKVGTGTGPADVNGTWSLVLDSPYVAAFASTTVVVSTNGGLSATLQDVAFGDVLLCVSYSL